MLANALCQAMQVALGDCVRQQAGSYGFHSVGDTSSARCRSALARECAESGNADGTERFRWSGNADALRDCVRQQAGSYGRHAPPIHHPPQSPCRSALARDALGQATLMALGDCVRQQAGSYGFHSVGDTSSPRCRSALARECAGSGNADGTERFRWSGNADGTERFRWSGNADGTEQLHSPASRLLRTSYPADTSSAAIPVQERACPGC